MFDYLGRKSYGSNMFHPAAMFRQQGFSNMVYFKLLVYSTVILLTVLIRHFSFNPPPRGLRRTRGWVNSPQLAAEFWVQGLPWGSYQLIYFESYFTWFKEKFAFVKSSPAIQMTA